MNEPIKRIDPIKLAQSAVLHKSLKQTQRLTSLFVILNMGRFLIISLLTVLALSTPYTQTILICLLNTAMLLYLIVFRPFVSWKITLKLIFIEALTAMSSYATAFLANLDRSDGTDTEQRISAGWVIFVSKILITFTVATVFLINITTAIGQKVIPSLLRRKWASTRTIAKSY